MAQETQQKKNPAPVVTWELLSSAVAGVISGLIGAGAAIRKEFNEEVRKWAGMRDFSVPVNDMKIYEQKGFTLTSGGTADYHGNVTFKGIDTEHAEKLFENDLRFIRERTDSKENAKITRTEKNGYAERKARILLNEYGIHSKGLKGLFYGTYQRLARLGDSDRWLTGFTGVSTAAIVSVTAYNLITGILTRNKTRQIEDILLDRVLEMPEVKEHHAAAMLGDNAHPANQVREVSRVEPVKALAEHKAATRV